MNKRKHTRQQRQEQINRLVRGESFRDFVRKLVHDLKDTDLRLRIAVADENAPLFDEPTRAIIEREIAPIAELLTTLVERARGLHP